MISDNAPERGVATSYAALYRSVERDLAPYAPYLTARDTVAHSDQTLLTFLWSLVTTLHVVERLLTPILGSVAERIADRVVDRVVEHAEDRAIDGVLDGVTSAAARLGRELSDARSGPPAAHEGARVAGATRAADVALEPAMPYVAAAVDGGASFEAAVKRTAGFLVEAFDLPPSRAAKLAAAVGEHVREAATAAVAHRA